MKFGCAFAKSDMPARASGQYGHQDSVNTSPTTIICSENKKLNKINKHEIIKLFFIFIPLNFGHDKACHF
jgi:hypothetical protein